jgi:hypothetical protein
VACETPSAEARNHLEQGGDEVFVQVIQGRVRSASDAMEQFDRWMDEVRPGAIGWLGTTGGVTPDGELVVLARFASAEEARRNSDRPEQTAWWREMEALFDGPVTFHDCEDVAPILGGGRDDAGFVQIMEWPSAGTHPAAELAETTAQMIREHRPDIMGGLVAIAEDGTAYEEVFFTSEEAAREQERAPMPADVDAAMAALMEEFGEPVYHDLRTPMLVS